MRNGFPAVSSDRCRASCSSGPSRRWPTSRPTSSVTCVGAEPLEGEAVDDRPSGQVGEHTRGGVAEVLRAAPKGGDQAHLGQALLAEEVVDEQRGRGAGPVQVLQHHQHGCGPAEPGEQVDDGLEQPVAPGGGILRRRQPVARVGQGEAGQEQGQVGGAGSGQLPPLLDGERFEQRAEGLDERLVGHVEAGGAGPGHHEARPGRAPSGRTPRRGATSPRPPRRSRTRPGVGRRRPRPTPSRASRSPRSSPRTATRRPDRAPPAAARPRPADPAARSTGSSHSGWVDAAADVRIRPVSTKRSGSASPTQQGHGGRGEDATRFGPPSQRGGVARHGTRVVDPRHPPARSPAARPIPRAPPPRRCERHRRVDRDCSRWRSARRPAGAAPAEHAGHRGARGWLRHRADGSAPPALPSRTQSTQPNSGTATRRSSSSPIGRGERRRPPRALAAGAMSRRVGRRLPARRPSRRCQPRVGRLGGPVGGRWSGRAHGRGDRPRRRGAGLGRAGRQADRTSSSSTRWPACSWPCPASAAGSTCGIPAPSCAACSSSSAWRPCCPSRRQPSAVELVRQAEGGEQRGVEEVVEPRDPPV